MSFFETYGKEIFALAVPLLTWVLNTFFKARAKLFLSSPHNFTFLIAQPITDAQGVTIPMHNVTTSSIMLRNAGRETATKVEFVFNWKPEYINIWPSRHTTEHTEADNRYIVILDSLAPNETVGFELLAWNKALPTLLVARSDQCVAENIEMYPQPMVKDWLRRTAMFLIFAGLTLTVYLAILLIQFLVLKTPLGH